MACHEIAALRIALHRLLGTRPEHERSEEYAELGAACTGALKALAEASDLAAIRRALDAAGAELDARVAGMSASDPQLGYHRALVVTARGLLRDVERMSAWMERFYLDIEDTHDLLHEAFPGSNLDG